MHQPTEALQHVVIQSTGDSASDQKCPTNDAGDAVILLTLKYFLEVSFCKVIA